MTPANPPLGPFEPRLVRQRKRRARGGFREAAFLHAQGAADLADRLEAIPRNFLRTLALGGGGLFSAELAQRPALRGRLGHVLEVDLGGGAVEIDPEHLPFGDGAFDLVHECYTLQALPDAPRAEAMRRLARFVRPGGTLLVIARARDDGAAPSGPPWPLARPELIGIAARGLTAETIERLPDPTDGKSHWRAVFRRGS